MRRRTRISLMIIAVAAPVAVLSLLSWMASQGPIANVLFQASGSIVVIVAFFGIMFPAAARWALRVGGTTARAQRNPVTRLMIGLDENDR
ncbi:hypothetical protein SAMN06273572_105183 [Monaibacterium marinum]|uniref:Uncharacterized protein n=1 Tax=Pontivivens marinum TaxID=1690039 RepID=A0A2C9CWE0_9RHOB|nr:hypothetical protein [Monaibacterium marinum]SOH94759.1 hypothetical protein SAMN06273572_105183 [Monaibacterium marinum]